MSFCTVINCMDGRVQLPAIKYLQNRFNADYVDSITEPGPNFILAEQTPPELLQSILDRIDISIKKHKSKGIAIVGHYDCAGNPARQDDQIAHIRKAICFLHQRHRNIEIIGLWIDENWEVHELFDNEVNG